MAEHICTSNLICTFVVAFSSSAYLNGGSRCIW